VQTQENTPRNLADVLGHLSEVLREAAQTVRNLHDEDGSDLPPTLYTRHMAKLYGKNPSTIWRLTKLRKLPPPISEPGENMAWDRGMVLEDRRRRRQLALAQAAGG
jgi:hypothetical protein